MRNFELTDEQHQELCEALRLARRKNDARSALKINAVLLLGLGWSIDEVKDVFFIDDETARSYSTLFKRGGIKELVQTNYTGGKSNITEDQSQLLKLELNRNLYLTTKEVCEYVESTFSVKYSESGMAKLLYRLNFVYKKPKLVPANPNSDLQEEFVEQYLDFMETKGEKVKVFFADAVHPTHNTMAEYGWIEKGTTRTLESNSGRSRFNIHGAMDAETFEVTTVMGESNVDSDSTIALLQSLEQAYLNIAAIYVIVDNAKYHFSKVVREYLKTSRVILVSLPSYSPELNLIERLWRVFKKEVLYNKYYEKFSDFKKACAGFFVNQSKYREKIASIMGEGLAALEF